MTLGKPQWCIVSSDHIGVPHGGLFGNIRRWEPKLNKHGLYLYWSLIHEMFGVYTILRNTGELVNQMLLKHKDHGPLTLDKSLVDTLVYLRETHNRTDQVRMLASFKARKSAEKAKAQAEAAEERADRAKRATDMAFMALGVKPRKTMIELGN